MAVRGFIAHDRESGAYALTDSGYAALTEILVKSAQKAIEPPSVQGSVVRVSQVRFPGHPGNSVWTIAAQSCSDAPQHLGNPRCSARALGRRSIHATPGDAAHLCR
jgi:hypothetical protein